MTSCDETTEPTQLIQRYDDDKLELVSYQHWWDVAFFMFSSFGQARSPIQVELISTEEDHKSDDINNNSIVFALDGEAYFVRGGQHIKVEQDPALKQIKMQRRAPKLKDINKTIAEMGHLAPPFV